MQALQSSITMLEKKVEAYKAYVLSHVEFHIRL
jgi:hypothetical protein